MAHPWRSKVRFLSVQFRITPQTSHSATSCCFAGRKLVQKNMEPRRRVELLTCRLRIHWSTNRGATAGGIEQRRGIAAMHRADGVVRVLVWYARKHSSARVLLPQSRSPEPP